MNVINLEIDVDMNPSGASTPALVVFKELTHILFDGGTYQHFQRGVSETDKNGGIRIELSIDSFGWKLFSAERAKLQIPETTYP